MSKAKRTPTFTSDENGNDIALVPLANHSNPARVLRKDFDALRAAGWSDQWTFNDSGNGYAYVKVGNSQSLGNLAIVARLLMKPGKREMIRYRDGDRTNLVRSNLYIEPDPRGKKGKTPGAKLMAGAQSFAAAVARFA